MKENEPKINCPRFQRQEPIIENISGAINQAKGPQEKAVCAEALRKEVDAILSCPDYDGESVDCSNCRLITNLRMKTAGLIIKAGKLA